MLRIERTYPTLRSGVSRHRSGNRLLLRLLLAVLSGCGLGLSADAAPKKSSYTIRDGGLERKFEVSTSGDAVYPSGKARFGSRKRFLTSKLIVKPKIGADADAIASAVGGKVINRPGYAPEYVVIEIADKSTVLDVAETLRSNPDVESADPLLGRQRSKRAVTIKDPLFPYQWHLKNTGQRGGTPGIDANVKPAWNSATGNGVVIGIVDDGIQYSHPDLLANLLTGGTLNHNWNDGSPVGGADPSNGDFHGTSCAGIAAGVRNGTGIVGAAFDANLVSLRLIAGPSTDLDEAEAFTWANNIIQIKNNSWGPYEDGQTLEGPGQLASAALENGATEGRNHRGTIYVFANGNGRHRRENSNYDGYANSIYVTSVGALSDRGVRSDYSEPGANMLVTAPSSSKKRQGTTTTDLTGEDGYNGFGLPGTAYDFDYTNEFGGTSSAAPLVSGIVALMLETNPALGWRDVQEILVQTATVVNAADPDWITNGAGFHFNHKYGAGLVDAASAIAMSGTWTNLGPMVSVSTSDAGINLPIPDKNKTGIIRDLTIGSDVRVEHVVLTVDIDHARRGDLDVQLTSPSGVVSRLATLSGATTDNFKSWSFSSVHHWGESATGTWKVQVRDRRLGTKGKLNSLKLKIYGTTPDALIVPVAASIVSGTLGDPASPVEMRFALKNSGTTDTSNLVATMLPSAGITPLSTPQSYGVLQGGGLEATGTFQFSADSRCGEVRKVLLQVQDNALDLGTVEFSFIDGVITTYKFSSSTPIGIPHYGPASKYPSTITVPPVSGIISDVRVHLNGFEHQAPFDLDMMLVGPAGKRAVFMSDAGGFEPVSAIDLIFSDDSDFGLNVWRTLSSGTYHTSNLGRRLDTFPAPAPPVKAIGTLSGFRGTNPTGKWKLYIFDAYPRYSGSIQSWDVEFDTVNCPTPVD